MAGKGRILAERIQRFTDDLLAFIEGCSDTQWGERLPWEEWSVGVTARHIAAGHLEAVSLARLIVQGRPLPELSAGQLAQLANEHARKHAGCTRADVAGILRRNAAATIDWIAGLSDEELDRTADVPFAGGEISAADLIRAVVLRSGGEHFEHMKAAAGAPV